MLSKHSNKNLLYIFTVLLLIILSACVASVTRPSAPVSVMATAQPASAQPPSPTDDLATQKQKILDEGSRQITAFNQLVEQEKLLGDIETGHNAETGQDFFRFTGESDKKIRAASEELTNQINILHEKYLALYEQDYNPTPFPVFNTKDEKLKFYYQALQEDNDWMDVQLKSKNALKVYDPDRGAYESILNFEQSAWLDLRGNALNQLRMEAELSPELLAKHKALVEKLDGGAVVSNEIDGRPYYRNDLTLFQYQTQKNYYVLNADGAIIEITPVDQSVSTQLVLASGSVTTQPAPNTAFTQSQLGQQARAFINLIAPGTNLDALTLTVGSKINVSFFKWEDQTKPPLDGGGFPFIQVALNSNGEMLNYTNTLPLSR